MEKSNDTPDSATPDPTVESGSGRLVDIPHIPCRILSALDYRSYLYFRDEFDYTVRITRAENPPPFSAWKFYSLGDGTYNIRSHPNDYLYLTGDSNSPVTVESFNDHYSQVWSVVSAGSDLVYLKIMPPQIRSEAISPDKSMAEHRAVSMVYDIGTKEEQFMLIMAF
ncbi:RICIN domain-containing protein [Pseudomonas gingeri]